MWARAFSLRELDGGLSPRSHGVVVLNVALKDQLARALVVMALESDLEQVDQYLRCFNLLKGLGG